MFIEMAYPLSPEIPVFPGLPLDEFVPHTRMKKGDPSNTTVVKHFLHNGTHVDAPFHFYDKGLTIDQVPVEKFYYSKPLMIQKKLSSGGLILVDDLMASGAALFEADILLFVTSYYEFRTDKSVYEGDFPSLSREAAEFIRTELLNVKAVAIDTLSIESCVLGPKLDFIVHKTLLDGDLFSTRPLLIYEDVNMGAVLNQKIERIYAFPIRFVGLDGSPASMVAEVKS
jgi:kynurenine formamidase